MARARTRCTSFFLVQTLKRVLQKNSELGSARIHGARSVVVYNVRLSRTRPAAAARIYVRRGRALRVPMETFRNWGLGKDSAKPVFALDDPERRFLSFMNFVEAHILTGIRKKHGVKLPMIRSALNARCSTRASRPTVDALSLRNPSGSCECFQRRTG